MHISYKDRLLWQIKVTHPLAVIICSCFTNPWRFTRVPSVMTRPIVWGSAFVRQFTGSSSSDLWRHTLGLAVKFSSLHSWATFDIIEFLRVRSGTQTYRDDSSVDKWIQLVHKFDLICFPLNQELIYSRWFCNPPPPVWGGVLLYLWSPKGCYCLVLDVMSCS